MSMLRVLVLPSMRGLVARGKVQEQRAAARRALGELGLEEPLADPDGVPLPTGGRHWSVSHTEGASAAVLGSEPVGVDLEHEREISARLLERFLSTGEPAVAALTAWTAKEAVLKKTRVGLVGLPGCRIVGQPEEQLLEISFEGRIHRVQTVRHGPWYGALSSDEPGWVSTWEWRA